MTSSKIDLPQVTLICLTGKDKEAHKQAIEKSCEGIRFGDVKLVWDRHIESIDDWNKKVIYQLWKKVETPYAMLIHADGYIIHPELWNPDWLNYDYIGAPWPLPKDDYSYRTPKGELVRVGNSVSLRSRKLMRLPTDLNLEWKPFHGNTNEDGKLCVEWRDILKENYMEFAPLEVAVHFSKEHEIPENKGLETFAFHSL